MCRSLTGGYLTTRVNQSGKGALTFMEEEKQCRMGAAAITETSSIKRGETFLDNINFHCKALCIFKI